MDKKLVGQGRTLIRASLTAKRLLQEMAAADGSTGAALLHKLVMAEWQRREAMNRYTVKMVQDGAWHRAYIMDTQTGEEQPTEFVGEFYAVRDRANVQAAQMNWKAAGLTQ